MFSGSGKATSAGDVKRCGAGRRRRRQSMTHFARCGRLQHPNSLATKFGSSRLLVVVFSSICTVAGRADARNIALNQALAPSPRRLTCGDSIDLDRGSTRVARHQRPFERLIQDVDGRDDARRRPSARRLAR